MHDQPHPAMIAELVDSIDARSPQQADLIVRGLLRGWWPGGLADRTSPAAAEWVRRWHLTSEDHEYRPDCSCVAGRCRVCN